MSPEASGPLTGLKVLDFSTLLPGPFASQLLADMGAEVIRIESPSRPDLLRQLSPRVGGESAAHLSLNRNKRSLALDLKAPEARAVVRRLVAEHDILLEQFRPGVMARLGLDYPSLSECNPALIYCSLTGYGQSGPLASRAGHDINYLALSGLASYSGRREPVLGGTQLADLAGGSQQAVIAILAALFERQRSGRGQHLDVAMAEGALALNALAAAAVGAGAPVPGPGTEVLNGGGVYDYYATADDRYLAVGALEPQFALAFFRAIGRPKWASQASATAGQQARLKGEIAEVIAGQTLAYWQQVFAPLDCCVEPVLTLDEAMAHPQFVERGMVRQVDHQGQKLTQLACPLNREQQIRPGAALGEDSLAVLRELGFGEEEVADLARLGVIAG
ncbi:CoA transferase [Ferrimonas sediminicola]|uniref:CoA transferase n=1 Tax=Ferrimonas sediminicola TaxID=2569538 RepID=A0A4U1BAC9_9GAMM|nr:CaiB/BaiF CoA-transferase family protein [Ferrimonas sediminicola]TKB47773.1 CoA transferase [Ferrimonas sediminicola]